MFGIYSNQRLTDNERKILDMHPDDYNWYCVVMRVAFNDERFFQVREDIEVPEADDDGVILMFQGGDVIYFRTVNEDIGDEEYESIMKVCSFLKDKFNRQIDVYLLCPPDIGLCVSHKTGVSGVRIFFSSFASDDGEEIIERLEAKLDNDKEFTTSDSIDHMLLPYSGYKDKDDFQEKFQRYMKKIDECGALKQVDL